jgi:hypothetical protein
MEWLRVIMGTRPDMRLLPSRHSKRTPPARLARTLFLIRLAWRGLRLFRRLRPVLRTARFGLPVAVAVLVLRRLRRRRSQTLEPVPYIAPSAAAENNGLATPATAEDNLEAEKN